MSGFVNREAQRIHEEAVQEYADSNPLQTNHDSTIKFDSKPKKLRAKNAIGFFKAYFQAELELERGEKVKLCSHEFWFS